MPSTAIHRHPEGSRPPLVMVHTWDTDAARLHALADHLGPDQPVIGIEPPDPEDGPMPETVEEWVAHALAALPEHDLVGPYRLAGFSFGGVVALEMARRLRAKGEEIVWLGMIDTLRPKLNPKGAGPYLRYHARELLELPDAEHRRREAWRLVHTGMSRNKYKAKRAVRQQVGRLGLMAALPPPRADMASFTPLRRAIWVSYLKYEGERYDGAATLFTGDANRAKAAGDPSLRWSGYLRGGFEVIPIEGEHLELFAPAHIKSVGGAVAACLERVSER